MASENVAEQLNAPSFGTLAKDSEGLAFGRFAPDLEASAFGTVAADLEALTFGNIAADLKASPTGNAAVDLEASAFGNVAADLKSLAIGGIAVHLKASVGGDFAADLALAMESVAEDLKEPWAIGSFAADSKVSAVAVDWGLGTAEEFVDGIVQAADKTVAAVAAVGAVAGVVGVVGVADGLYIGGNRNVAQIGQSPGSNHLIL